MLGLAVFAGCLAMLVGGVLWRPAIGIAALLVMFGLEQWGTSQIEAIARAPLLTNIVIAAIVMLAAVVHMLRHPIRLPFTQPIPMLATTLYVYAAFSLIWSLEPQLGWSEILVKAPYLMLVCLVVPILVRRHEDVGLALLTVVVVGTILLIPMAFAVPWDDRTLRSTVFPGEKTGSSLGLAQFCGYVIVAAALMAPRSVLFRAASAAIVVLALAVMIRTGTRGQLGATLLCAALFLPVAHGYTASWRSLVSVAAAGALGLLVVTLYGDVIFVGDYSWRWQSASLTEDAGGRLEMILQALSAWVSTPIAILLGLGFASVRSPQILNDFYTHNVPVEVLVELGAVGFTIFAFAMVRSARTVFAAIRSVSRDRRADMRNRVIATLAALCVLEILVSLKQGTLYSNFFLFLFPVVLESLLVQETRRRQARTRKAALARTPPPEPPQVPQPHRPPWLQLAFGAQGRRNAPRQQRTLPS